MILGKHSVWILEFKVKNMIKEVKKIKTEVAIGIILLVGITFTILIYRAGSFSEALNYIPMISKKKEKPADNSNNWILFAEKGDRKAYKYQQEDGKWVVVVDGQAGESYDEVFGGVFSDDGKHFAYGTRNDGWEFIILDNQESEQKYSKIGEILFDNDGRLIYKVIEEDGEFLVIDGQEGQKYDKIVEIVILDDGRVAYQVEINGETVTVIDGQVVKEETPAIEGDNSDGNNSGESGSGAGGTGTIISPPKTKTNRQKKDVVVPISPQSPAVCSGVDCNF